MNVLIIEDEIPASKHLQQILDRIGNITIIGILDSIAETIEWFGKNPQPEIVFMDIHLADGSAFKIFEFVNITSPIIFTTAYDEYAMNAFKVNSIDYLLKPITKEAVEKSLKKMKILSTIKGGFQDIQQLIAMLKQEKSYKTHFLVGVKGNKLIPLLAKEIAYFNIDSGEVVAKTFEENIYKLDFTLDELASKLNPNDFFRANRQFIISKSAVKEVDFWFNNRLSINLKVSVSERILISRTRVTEFRDWFAGE